MDLSPDAFEEQPETQNADYPPIGHNVRDDLGSSGLHSCVSRHGRPAHRRKYRPQRDCKRRADPGVFLSLVPSAHAEPSRHDRIYPHSSTHRQRYHKQLQRINYRQRRKSRIGVIPHEKAVYYIVQRLDKLRQHYRRGYLQQHPAYFFFPKKLVSIHHISL